MSINSYLRNIHFQTYCTIRATQLVVVKLTVDSETTDVLWKFQKHALYSQLDQIQFNKVAKTYLTRFIRDIVRSGHTLQNPVKLGVSRHSRMYCINGQCPRKNSELVELANGQFQKAKMLLTIGGLHSEKESLMGASRSNLTHFHALGKVLYNKYDGGTGLPENTAHDIVQRQPSNFNHFNNQLVKHLPEFNKLQGGPR